MKKAQEGVLEFLLANHPLDCPVCDKGGECPLQDQAFSHGPGESRYVEAKRNYEKPIPISDLVFLDRERCILCDRCTRFAKEVAGDPLIHFTSRGNNTQVQTFPGDPFSSYFSGNTVQICPVGALTAKPYRFKARPWDLDQTEARARRVRLVVRRWCRPVATSCCVTRVTMTTTSTGAGCATRVVSVSSHGTASNGSSIRWFERVTISSLRRGAKRLSRPLRRSDRPSVQPVQKGWLCSGALGLPTRTLLPGPGSPSV